MSHRNTASPDLGYHWIWTWGHLIPAGIFTAIAGLLALVGLPWWLWLFPALIAGWAFAGFLVMRFLVRMGEIPRISPRVLPATGAARLLDVGCGSGRLSIALARSLPKVEIVGLDNFSATYIRGHGSTKTEANYRLAGIAERATIRSGDMRQMPVEDAAFDAVASSAAIDHLPDADVRLTLSEVRRVLKPGGWFLLVVSVPNVWLGIAFGPTILRRLRKRDFWRETMSEAGLTLEREGSLRASAWFLASRSA